MSAVHETTDHDVADHDNTDHDADKETIRRLHDAINTGDLELISRAIDEFVAPDAIVRTPLPIGTTGARALKEVFTKLLRAFPDLHVTVEDLIAEGDKVVSRNTVAGTNRGVLMGRPPTGKPVVYSEIFVFRFAGGRIAETWGVVDVFSQMRQLGVTPAPAEQPRVEADRKAA
jgi:steroid delta-isomerase-like uncharacterized protein